jgi:undecaprenyl-diphosphatase
MHKKNWLSWVIALLSIISFIIIYLLYLKGQLNNFDNNIYHFIIQNKNPFLTNFYIVISNLCSYILVIILLSLFLLFYKNKKQSLMLVFLTTGTFLLNFIVKMIVKRPRPIGIALINETNYSFPSSHAMVSIAMYGFIIYLINKTNIQKINKIIITICLSFLIGLIGCSRIYLGVHFASDVLAGYLLGLSFLICFINLIYNKFITKK